MSNFARLMVVSGKKDLEEFGVIELEFFAGENGDGKRLRTWKGPSVHKSTTMGGLLAAALTGGGAFPSISLARALHDELFLSKVADFMYIVEEGDYILVDSIGQRKWLLW